MTAVSKLSSKVKCNGGFTGSLVLMQKITFLRANEKGKLEIYKQKNIFTQKIVPKKNLKFREAKASDKCPF